VGELQQPVLRTDNGDMADDGEGSQTERPRISYRPSRTFFLFRLIVWLGAFAFGLYGLLFYATGSESSLRGQYWIVTLVGVGLTGRELYKRQHSPMKTVLADDELLLEDSRVKICLRVSDIAGIGVVRRPIRAPALTWHMWQPVCWTVDGSLHGVPGVTSLGGRKSTKAVIESRAGRVAQDLYANIRLSQGESGLVKAHRLRARPSGAEVLIEILDYSSHGGHWLLRWDADTQKVRWDDSF